MPSWAWTAGYAEVVVAQANVAEAELVPGARVRGYRTLARLACDFGADPQELALDFEPEDEEASPDARTGRGPEPDIRDVSGQGDARRALEVAAAGAHHLLLSGPPGAGKTMLAERLPGLLPDLGDTEAMEVTAIHSLHSLERGVLTARGYDRVLRLRCTALWQYVLRISPPIDGVARSCAAAVRA